MAVQYACAFFVLRAPQKWVLRTVPRTGLQQAKEAAAAVDCKVPFVSSTDILTSWFGHVCGPRWLMGTMNCRGHGAVLGADHAGNYFTFLLFGEEGYATPTAVRQVPFASFCYPPPFPGCIFFGTQRFCPPPPSPRSCPSVGQGGIMNLCQTFQRIFPLQNVCRRCSRSSMQHHVASPVFTFRDEVCQGLPLNLYSFNPHPHTHTHNIQTHDITPQPQRFWLRRGPLPRPEQAPETGAQAVRTAPLVL